MLQILVLGLVSLFLGFGNGAQGTDLAKTWNQLDEAGVGEKLRKNPDVLERAKSFDCN